ncbi:hypothetical protein I3760_02G026300 [Carya illinoinensis]|nr:hypothetical protein I3760_02G026300 [Carya illinoinensis]
MDPFIELREVHFWPLGSLVNSPVSPPLILTVIIVSSLVVASISTSVVMSSSPMVITPIWPLMVIIILGLIACFISWWFKPLTLMFSQSARTSRVVAPLMDPSLYKYMFVLHMTSSSILGPLWLMHGHFHTCLGFFMTTSCLCAFGFGGVLWPLVSANLLSSLSRLALLSCLIASIALIFSSVS